jgi:diguanylate cyclase (GGDEF)-like protein
MGRFRFKLVRADQLDARVKELEEERRRVRETTLRFGEALAATHDIDELQRVIVETAVELTGATRGRLVTDDDILGVDEGTARLELPLGAFGTLELVGDEFSSDQREAADWLIGHALIALGNAQRHRTVEKQALVDGLTGLANRRLCAAALEQELARAERFGEPFALVLADIDDFKAVNDRFGHPTGDEVLRAFADRLQGSIREVDLAGRWGGEEFAVLLPETDLEGGAKLAERIRHTFAEQELVAANGHTFQVTASFGVAAFPAASSPEQLVADADRALYDAKRSGKNRVGAGTVTVSTGT